MTIELYSKPTHHAPPVWKVKISKKRVEVRMGCDWSHELKLAGIFHKPVRYPPLIILIRESRTPEFDKVIEQTQEQEGLSEKEALLFLVEKRWGKLPQHVEAVKEFYQVLETAAKKRFYWNPKNKRKNFDLEKHSKEVWSKPVSSCADLMVAGKKAPPLSDSAQEPATRSQVDSVAVEVKKLQQSKKGTEIKLRPNAMPEEIEARAKENGEISRKNLIRYAIAKGWPGKNEKTKQASIDKFLPDIKALSEKERRSGEVIYHYDRNVFKAIDDRITKYGKGAVRRGRPKRT
jgi:hypothetical protein